MKITDYYSQDNKLFYVTLFNKTTPVQIRRITNEALWIDINAEIKQAGLVKGFIVAKNQTGIIIIEGKVSLEQITESKFDVMEIKINKEAVKLVNRRNFFRLDFEPLKELTLTTSGNNWQLKTKLLNISAGGIAFENTNLEATPDGIYLSQFDLADDFPIKYPVQIISQRKLFEEKQNMNTVAAAFFITRQELSPYPILKEKDQSRIISYINKALTRERSLKLSQNSLPH
ncbi:MAG: hypothetical protein ACD_73C00586G0001 [uncultured bacterium]|nr:MAG: hypothetical protein ACD_73C00586G0001 [uncultured bacterium]